MATYNDRKTTKFWVDPDTKPALEKRDIYVRYDADADKRGVEPDIIAQQAGGRPLIRIGDYRLSSVNLSSVSLEIGEMLLPVISITFKDEEIRFQKNVTSKQELVDFFYGSTKDGYYIKQQYRLLNTYLTPSGPYVTVSAQLWVPKLYEIKTRSFKKKSSYEVIKELCKECGLGLWTNIRTTNDTQTWIQAADTNLEFLKNVITHCFVSDESRVIAFIDQYDYLNLIDVNAAINNREKEKVKVNPYTHEDLKEEFEVVLSNKLDGQDNKKQKDEKNQNMFPIEQWCVGFSYGQNEDELPGKIKRNIIDGNKRKIEIESSVIESNTKLIPSISYLTKKCSCVHDNYIQAELERSYKIAHFQQGDTIEAVMRYPCYFLYPWMYTPVRLFYMKTKGEHDDQTSDMTAEEMYDKTANIKFPDENDAMEYENVLHSGDYIIESISYEFVDPDSDPEEELNCKQILRLHRQPLNEIPKQLQI